MNARFLGFTALIGRCALDFGILPDLSGGERWNGLVLCEIVHGLKWWIDVNLK